LTTDELFALSQMDGRIAFVHDMGAACCFLKPTEKLSGASKTCAEGRVL
jgi:hypothetical protein